MSHKITLMKVLSVVTCFLVNVTANASDNIIPIPTQPEQAIITPAAPNLDAKGYILVDANSGKVLVEKNPDTHMAPASLTKLMSLYIMSGALKNGSIRLNDKVIISKKAWQTDGSRMFIKPGDEVTVKDLLHGIIVASGNDATVALAEHVAGTEETFTNIMNTQAQSLGMKNSHFIDSTGLPNPEHYSTPRDLAILAQALYKYYPQDYKLFAEKWFTYKGIRQPNRNRLLWRYQYADGLKTGHTADAGYCLVASASKDGMRLISVIMGSPNDDARTEDSIRLLNYGFRFYQTHKLYQSGITLAKGRVWKGEKTEIPLGLAQDFYVTYPAGQYKNLKGVMQINNNMKAPIKKGQVYGKLNIMLNKQIIASAPLIALSANDQGGFLRRVLDTFHFTYYKLFSHSSEQANNG